MGAAFQGQTGVRVQIFKQSRIDALQTVQQVAINCIHAPQTEHVDLVKHGLVQATAHPIMGAPIPADIISRGERPGQVKGHTRRRVQMRGICGFHEEEWRWLLPCDGSGLSPLRDPAVGLWAAHHRITQANILADGSGYIRVRQIREGLRYQGVQFLCEMRVSCKSDIM